MDGLLTAAVAQPLWLWLALAGVLLAVELATGSGWLLWPAGSAAVTGLVVMAVKVAPESAVGFFAILTIVTTVAGRRLLRRPAAGLDINDPTSRMVGQKGVAAEKFKDGQGRVLIDGNEWQSELDGGGELKYGAPVIVTGIVGGSRLRVKTV